MHQLATQVLAEYQGSPFDDKKIPNKIKKPKKIKIPKKIKNVDL